mmetsp:Transcript_6744/g.16377  ORF Transcript_6744/g.16377 Transcript_6744/m.16377 type:complete len:328 (-) Transcript_6744:30-1013(-)
MGLSEPDDVAERSRDAASEVEPLLPLLHAATVHQPVLVLADALQETLTFESGAEVECISPSVVVDVRHQIIEVLSHLLVALLSAFECAALLLVELAEVSAELRHDPGALALPHVAELIVAAHVVQEVIRQAKHQRDDGVEHRRPDGGDEGADQRPHHPAGNHQREGETEVDATSHRRSCRRRGKRQISKVDLHFSSQHRSGLDAHSLPHERGATAALSQSDARGHSDTQSAYNRSLLPSLQDRYQLRQDHPQSDRPIAVSGNTTQRAHELRGRKIINCVHAVGEDLYLLVHEPIRWSSNCLVLSTTTASLRYSHGHTAAQLTSAPPA